MTAATCAEICDRVMAPIRQIDEDICCQYTTGDDIIADSPRQRVAAAYVADDAVVQLILQEKCRSQR